MNVAITHDFMDVYGGAERVTHEFAKAFPDATVTAIVGRLSVARRMGVEHRFRSMLPRGAWFLSTTATSRPRCRA
jgi:hypothetical protein